VIFRSRKHNWSILELTKKSDHLLLAQAELQDEWQGKRHLDTLSGTISEWPGQGPGDSRLVVACAGTGCLPKRRRL